MPDDELVDWVEVYEADDGWRWRAKAANGEVVAQGESYTERGSALELVTELFPDVPVRVED